LSKLADVEAFSFDESWAVVRALLPDNLEEVARQTGLVKRLRGFDNAELILRLLLMHGSGLSLEQAAARAAEQGLAKISAVTLFNRLQQSEAFLGFLAKHVLSGLQQRLGAGRWPQGLKYRIIDATEVTEPGATGSNWRVHYSLRLPELACDHFEVTDYRQGETFKRWGFAPDEVALADRAYSHREALAGLLEGGTRFVVRLNTSVFALENAHGHRRNLLKLVKPLKVGHAAEWDLWFSWAKRRYPVRLCAVRKSAAAAARSQAKAHRRAQQERVHLRERTLEFAQFVLVLTSLEATVWTSAAVLELYRCRWQVELAFKRLKSLLQLGHLPKKDPAGARAWMQMKLLLALLVERLLFDAEFIFPWGYALQPDESLEGLPGGERLAADGATLTPLFASNL
jgi:Transposase DDE domain